jgi:hypothetical protein
MRVQNSGASGGMSARLISRLALVAAVVAAVAMVGAVSAGAKGVSELVPSPDPNGWYSHSVSGSFVFDVDGLDFSRKDGTYDERLSSLECSASGPGATFTSPPISVPFVPGPNAPPVEQRFSVSDTGPGGATVGCTAGYERKFYDDCREFGQFPFCNDVSDWTSVGTETGFRTIRVDTTPPSNIVIHRTSSPNANGWYNSPVTFTVSGEDDGSGISNCGFGLSVSTPSHTVNTDGSGSLPAGCRNFAGLVILSSVSWRYDSTPPALAPIVSPTGVLLRGSAATADARATDTPSGIDAANTGCDAVDTSVAGSFTVACHATDKAGNTNTGSAAYKVGFGFDGFFAPVDNGNTANIAKAGQAVPLKFNVSDANGPVTNVTSYRLSSTAEACDTSEPADTVEEYAAGASGLQNLGDGNYQINWKTDKAYAGQCRRVDVTLGDDSTPHSADFKFVK